MTLDIRPVAPEPGNRRPLPWRRLCLRERITYEYDDPGRTPLRIYVTAGFDPATLELRETFIRPRGNVDADLCRYFDDIGVLISRCLQFGDDLDALADGMGRVPTDVLRRTGLAAHSPIGAVIDALKAMRSDVVRTWPPPGALRAVPLPIDTSLAQP